MGCDAVLDRGPVLFSISIDRVENTEYHEAYKTILHKANRVPASPYVAAMFGFFSYSTGYLTENLCPQGSRWRF
jgi:hypothetical protein